MPGIPTKFVVADLVFGRLRARGGAEAALLDNPATLRFAYLGAIGATLGDFMAARPEVTSTPPNTPYFEVWRSILDMFAGNAATATMPATRGIYRDMKQLRDTLGKLKGIVDSAVGGGPVEKDIAKIELLNMASELEDLRAATTDIQTIVGRLNTLRGTIGSLIRNGGPASNTKRGPSRFWQPRDTLHGSRTGRYLQALRDLAAAGDDNAKAYALGASVGYATDLCGNPYVNSIVRAPYRNHWWRHRWVCNFVDTWVWGYYAQGGSATVRIPNVVPDPLYTNWPNLREAGLHRWIDFGLDPDTMFAAIRGRTPLPSVLPPAFVTFLIGAYTGTYGPPDLVTGVDAAGLQSAVAMAWLILWLQTSGEAIPSMPADQINYPDTCGARPAWVAADGSVATGGAPPTAPPSATKDTNPSVAEVVSGVVLAILGALGALAGNVKGGLEALGAGLALIADGETDPDWEKLRCDLGWTFAFFYNMGNALHELLKWSGLGFPYTAELAHNDIAFTAADIVTPADAALNTVRSREMDEFYPRSRWAPIPSTASNWANNPAEPLEQPTETVYPTFVQPTWPFHFVDGFVAGPPPGPGAPPAPPAQVNPLFSLPGRPALVRDQVEFGVRLARLNVPRAFNSLFGNAVDVSMELIVNTAPTQLLDWDLDGDPGIGYPTWRFPSDFASRNESIPE